MKSRQQKAGRPILVPENSCDLEIANRIARWARELLGCDGLEIDDDLFALGADAKHATKLLSRIKRTFRVDLEFAVVSEVRTARGLAREIRRGDGTGRSADRKWRCLVPIQPGGLRPPLFCVHAINGEIDLYVRLAEELGSEQPVYAFRSPLLFRENTRFTSLDELASIYVAELKESRPRGPYFLAGASMGGHLAFVMAQKLSESGSPPQMVLMIDAWVPGSEQYVKPTGRLGSLMANIRNGGFRYIARRLNIKASYAAEHIENAMKDIGCRAYDRAGRRLPPVLRFFQIEEAHKQAMFRHSFTAYAGRITLIRSVGMDNQSLSRRRDRTLGWSGIGCDNIDLIDYPANHISMLDPPELPSFAALVKSILMRHQQSLQENVQYS
jgi:thioesterase domain-containing protein